jgi:hypothetical protein
MSTLTGPVRRRIAAFGSDLDAESRPGRFPTSRAACRLARELKLPPATIAELEIDDLGTVTITPPGFVTERALAAEVEAVLKGRSPPARTVRVAAQSASDKM